MISCAYRWLRRACAIVFALAAFAAPVLAAANPQQEADTTTGWVYRWINFLIFVGALIWAFTNKGTRAYFRGRQKAIGDAIAESARAREEADRQERAAEQKMASLDKEIADLRARAKQESAAETQRIRALAQEEAKRIEQSAQAEIRAAERAAQSDLKAIAARLAIERAEALLRDQVNAQAESNLFRGFVVALQGASN
ncbi:MAG TPA: ATP synthase F0 subunit B [Candidatus Acidoferrales bacterium]|nr:ATP synthase F0 subunit B [Candidatus Acidoferrales bacterium]